MSGDSSKGKKRAIKVRSRRKSRDSSSNSKLCSLVSSECNTTMAQRKSATQLYLRDKVLFNRSPSVPTLAEPSAEPGAPGSFTLADRRVKGRLNELFFFSLPGPTSFLGPAPTAPSAPCASTIVSDDMLDALLVRPGASVLEEGAGPSPIESLAVVVMAGAADA